MPAELPNDLSAIPREVLEGMVWVLAQKYARCSYADVNWVLEHAEADARTLTPEEA